MNITTRLWLATYDDGYRCYVIADSIEDAYKILRKWKPTIKILGISLYKDCPILTKENVEL